MVVKWSPQELIWDEQKNPLRSSEIILSFKNEVFSILTGTAHYFIRQFQPKVLFMFGTIATSVCMVLIGICAYLQEYFPDLHYIETFSWMPVLSVIVAVIARATCILPVIYSVMSDYFSLKHFPDSLWLYKRINATLHPGAKQKSRWFAKFLWNIINDFAIIYR